LTRWEAPGAAAAEGLWMGADGLLLASVFALCGAGR